MYVYKANKQLYSVFIKLYTIPIYAYLGTIILYILYPKLYPVIGCNQQTN